MTTTLDRTALAQVVQQLEDVEDELLRLVEKQPRLVRLGGIVEGLRNLKLAVAGLKAASEPVGETNVREAAFATRPVVDLPRATH